MQKLKAGDLVIILRVDVDSSAYDMGIRAGQIGIIHCTFPPMEDGCDVVVRFKETDSYSESSWLRKIEPPEPGNWNDTAHIWMPRLNKLFT